MQCLKNNTDFKEKGMMEYIEEQIGANKRIHLTYLRRHQHQQQLTAFDKFLEILDQEDIE